MTTRTRSANLEYLPQDLRVHVVGAGPVGLWLTSLLQTLDGVSVHLYEKRREYTRTRMVSLAPYLVAESVEGYRNDHIDGETVAAVFDPPELDEGLTFRQAIPPDLMDMLRDWTQGFCPLNNIEQSLSELIDARGARDAVVVEPLEATPRHPARGAVARTARAAECEGEPRPRARRI